MFRRTSLAMLTLPILAPALGCGSPEGAPEDADYVEERETIGDTTIVRIRSGSVWGTPATPAEELAIGSLEGAEEDIFGQVLAIAPDNEGGAYAFDYQVPALRHYDADGRYLGTVGGEGQGPGEYGQFLFGLDVLADGRVFLHDGPGSRVNFYASDGEFLESWPVQVMAFSLDATTVDSLGHVFAKSQLGPRRETPNEPPNVGLVHLGPDGGVRDTIPPPAYEGEPTGSTNGMFLPAKEWIFDRWRRLVIGVSDRYEFEVRRADGSVLRVVREDWTPVPLEPEEKEERQAFMDWQEDRIRAAMAANPGRFPAVEWVPVPDHKPAFRAFRAGSDGTIWLMVHVQAEPRDEPLEPQGEDAPPPLQWTESPVWDVYRDDGTYLGRVDPPPDTRLVTFSLDRLWGVRTGDFDEQYVVRLRLQLPERAEADAMAGGGSHTPDGW